MSLTEYAQEQWLTVRQIDADASGIGCLRLIHECAYALTCADRE